MGWWGDNTFSCDHVEDSYLALRRYILSRKYGDSRPSHLTDDEIEERLRDISENFIEHKEKISDFLSKLNNKRLEISPSPENTDRYVSVCEQILGLTMLVLRRMGYYNHDENNHDYYKVIDIQYALDCGNYLLNILNLRRYEFLREQFYYQRKNKLENEIAYLEKVNELN